MGSHIFKNIGSSSLYASGVLQEGEDPQKSEYLVFRRESTDWTNSPNYTKVDISSVIKPGMYVYPLTRNAVTSGGERNQSGNPNNILTGRLAQQTAHYNTRLTGQGAFENLPYTADASNEEYFSRSTQQFFSPHAIVKVEEIIPSNDDRNVVVKLTHKLNIYERADEWLFDDEFNKTNDAKIGNDRIPAQLVSNEVTL